MLINIQTLVTPLHHQMGCRHLQAPHPLPKGNLAQSTDTGDHTPGTTGTQPQPGSHQAGKQGLMFQPLPGLPWQGCRPVPSLPMASFFVSLSLFVSACSFVPLPLFLSRFPAFSCSSSDFASTTLCLSYLFLHVFVSGGQSFALVFLVCCSLCLSAFASSLIQGSQVTTPDPGLCPSACLSSAFIWRLPLAPATACLPQPSPAPTRGPLPRRPVPLCFPCLGAPPPPHLGSPPPSAALCLPWSFPHPFPWVCLWIDHRYNI